MSQVLKILGRCLKEGYCLFWNVVCLLCFVFLLYYFAIVVVVGFGFWVSLSVFLFCYCSLLNCSGFLVL